MMSDGRGRNIYNYNKRRLRVASGRALAAYRVRIGHHFVPLRLGDLFDFERVTAVEAGGDLFGRFPLADPEPMHEAFHALGALN